MEWLKVYKEGILHGSLADTDDSTQLIWLKLLAMVLETREKNGYLRMAEGKPLSREYIAMVCHTSIEKLNKAISEFLQDRNHSDSQYPNEARIRIEPDGTIVIVNWAKYQNKPQPPEKKKKTPEEMERIQRKLDNEHPRVSIDVLTHDFGKDLVDIKTGEHLSEGGITDA